ncbi:MAG TPA: hypothetical protein VGM80_07140 [Gaiellaceae bacterium]
MELSTWHMWWKRSGAAQLRSILMDEWDPIGIHGVPEAADEYDSYLGQLGARLREGGGVDEISKYLTDIEEVHMGLGQSEAARTRNRALAQRLVDWQAMETQA